MTKYALLLDINLQKKYWLYLPQSSFQIVIQFSQDLTLNLSQNLTFVSYA